MSNKPPKTGFLGINTDNRDGLMSVKNRKNLLNLGGKTSVQNMGAVLQIKAIPHLKNEYK